MIGEADGKRHGAVGGGFAATLPELPESAATGEIAVVYGELKAFARVPFVALIYRHLATQDGALPWLWRGLRPLFASGALPDAASLVAETAVLPPLRAVTAAEWRRAGLDAAALAGIAAVLDAYGRANPINLLFARIARLVLDEAPATAPAVPEEGRPVRPARPPLPPLPALLPASAIPAGTSAALARLSRFDQPGAGAVTPSLYRHLAHWPGYLALVPGRLVPLYARGAIDAATATYQSAAEPVAGRLAMRARAPLYAASAPSAPSAELRSCLRATLAAFEALIPEMIAVGRLLRAALPLAPLR
jgi:hypothetical protein